MLLNFGADTSAKAHAFYPGLPKRRVSPHLRVSTRGSVQCSVLRVAVTGAGGETGSIVAGKLIGCASQFDARAVISPAGSRRKLSSLGFADDEICAVDITKDVEGLKEAFDGCDALVMLATSRPILKLWSIPGALWSGVRGGSFLPKFRWKRDMLPEVVDWIGGKNQIVAAKAAGVKRVIWVGSMGGTNVEAVLNEVGDGNIGNWKRKAEEYLIESGLEYTIIHPGRLIRKEVPGQSRVAISVDDEYYKKGYSIPRERVAEICLQCLGLPAAANRSIDVVCLKGEQDLDMKTLLQDMVKNCDYTINSQLNT